MHVGTGLPGYQIVGLPDEACRASPTVRAAVLSSGLVWPAEAGDGQPGSIGGAQVGGRSRRRHRRRVLAASEQVPVESAQRYGYVGELGLDGSVRPVPDVAPMVGVLGGHEVVVPVASQVEAHVVATDAVHPVNRLREVADVLIEGAPWPEPPPGAPPFRAPPTPDDCVDLPQEAPAIIVTDANGVVHQIGVDGTQIIADSDGLPADIDAAWSAKGGALWVGLEGSLDREASIGRLDSGALAKIATGNVNVQHVGTVDGVPVVARRLGARGGVHRRRHGDVPSAGRSARRLRHHRRLRRPPVRWCRSSAVGPPRCAPARRASPIAGCFSSMSSGSSRPPCSTGCARHWRTVRSASPGPLLDRFDLRVPAHMPGVDALVAGDRGEPTAVVAGRVMAAGRRLLERAGVLNGALAPDDLDIHAPIDAAAQGVASGRDRARGRLIGRGYRRIRRVARTIADLRSDPPDVMGAVGTLAGDASR